MSSSPGPRLRRAVLLATTLFGLAVPSATLGQSDPLPEIRRLYLAAVESERAIAPALAAIEAARSAPGVARGSRLHAVLTGYEGAVITLRAKHGIWPPSRLRHLQDGLAVLDTTIADHPDEAEIRYLRLMSCYYLPGIFGRNWSVRADFAALAELLPSVRAHYPKDLYEAIVSFVLDNGRLAVEQAEPLRATLSSGDD